jgi:hypothetical protein
MAIEEAPMTRPRSPAGGGRSSARDPLSLALAPDTPPEVLARLSRTRNRSVLRAVAMHPRTPPAVVFRLGFRFPEILAKHPVFLRAVERPEDLAAIPGRTLRSLLRVPLLPRAIAERLAHHPSSEVRRLLAARRPDDGRPRLPVIDPPEEANAERVERVVRMRFGIGEKSYRTLEEVGAAFTVTRERIRCIEASALRRLRHPSRSERLQDFIEDRPAFLDGTFSWTRRGYGYAAPPPVDLDRAGSHVNGGSWLSLAAILERAKAGDHTGVGVLKDLVSEPGASLRLRRARLGLLADAGTGAELDALAGWLREGPDYLRVDACWAASLAGATWLAPSMLEAHSRASGASDREAIALFISDLLEEEGGEIARAMRGPAGRFERAVQSEIARIGAERVPRWLGGEFSVRGLALRMSALLRNALCEVALSGAFIPLRHKFEAATGIDCSSFFAAGELELTATARILDEFLASPAPAGYQPGVRHFFGHPLPTW